MDFNYHKVNVCVMQPCIATATYICVYIYILQVTICVVNELLDGVLFSFSNFF